MKENLPNSDNKLFIDEQNNDLGAWLKHPSNKFFLYSEGYKKTGEELFNFINKNSFYKTSLIYPLVFVYRQFLELRMKEIIIMGYRFIDSPDDFPDEHSLLKLWNIYRNIILKQIESIDPKLLNNVERLLKEFHDEDPISMNFRYPVSRGPNRQESLSRNTIDILNFKSVIDKLIYFFDWQWEMLSHYQDMKNEMLTDGFRNYY